MKKINFVNGTKLNIVGGRYVSGNHYIDVTENYYCLGSLDCEKEFGIGSECNEEEAINWLQN